ncbi:MAG: hypothetical protein LPL00_10370 [Alphaproteobacteria bacterium]|nr:hypothetical protein [Alphaproteobacteria bacterium]MDX5370079.1 hypothetical protein [Alphaproteobacteria bacterium]MDX5464652.1 hypothetical protein [Alphaproteobacteria bacterium]
MSGLSLVLALVASHGLALWIAWRLGRRAGRAEAVADEAERALRLQRRMAEMAILPPLDRDALIRELRAAGI